ncbi:peptide MFS transporter [Fluviicola sp.]|uniref:peptide MFS transporter n=1 Tax=Fluviicola sp. TaxID=1917219 RepID=UPI00263147A8|nr:peptide MFS transporter [Fluviicola sp.]
MSEQILDSSLAGENQLESIQNFKGKYPKQLWALFFSEMWERFCFYAMRGMLAYFMTSELTFSTKLSNLQYGAIQAFVYAFTFLGGMLADKILGFRKSLVWGGLLMIAGSVILAVDPHKFFFIGITFNIIGTGFFKPNISSMVGQLYKTGDSRRDAGFLLFYSGINIGAMIGGYIIAIGKGTMFTNLIPADLRWNAAFGASGIAMAISLITFLLTKKNLGPIGLSPLLNMKPVKRSSIELTTYVLALASVPLIMIMVSNITYTDYFMYAIGPFSLVYFIYEMTKYSLEENKKLIAAFLFILFSVVYFAIFEQAGGSLALFAKTNVDSNLLGMTMDPNGVNNSINALFVIIFAPLVGLLFLGLAKKKLEPNSTLKFGLGFLLLGLGFFIFFFMRFSASDDGKGSLNFLALAYLVISFGELFLSPIGLSLMTKLAPQKMQGFMMGMWFLASAYGQYVAGLFGAGISPKDSDSGIRKMELYTQGYYDFAWYAIIAGVLLIALYPLMKYLMQEEK